MREMNWAMIDLGARICIARKPKCISYFLAGECGFAKTGIPGEGSTAKRKIVLVTFSTSFSTVRRFA